MPGGLGFVSSITGKNVGYSEGYRYSRNRDIREDKLAWHGRRGYEGGLVVVSCKKNPYVELHRVL